MSGGHDPSGERRRKLGVHEKAQSRAPQDGVVALPGRKFQYGRNVFRLEIGIVGEDLFSRRAGRQEIEHVLHSNSQTSNARTSAAYTGGHRNSIYRAHFDSALILALDTAAFDRFPNERALVGCQFKVHQFVHLPTLLALPPIDGARRSNAVWHP
jgi:hypothetical protein